METNDNIKTLLRKLITQVRRKVLGTLYLRLPIVDRIHRPVIDRGAYRILLSRSRFSIVLYRHPAMRRDDERFLQHHLEPGMTYVDIGANIGTTTLAAARAVGPTGRVIAFEPHPRTFSDLQKSVALNKDLAPRITLINEAVGDTLGEKHMTDLMDNDINHIDDSGVAVTMTTVDEALAHLPHIDLLKIDVEGYERNVLLGARETLARTGAVYFEVSERNFAAFGYAAHDLFGLFADCGFWVFTVEPEHFALHRVSEEYRCGDGFENMVALPSGCLDRPLTAADAGRPSQAV